MLLDDNFKTATEFVLRNPCLYGDFRTALDESEPRLYEDIQDYDAAKALFQEVIIYIFIAIALDESIFLDVLYFPMKNIVT